MRADDGDAIKHDSCARCQGELRSRAAYPPLCDSGSRAIAQADLDETVLRIDEESFNDARDVTRLVGFEVAQPRRDPFGKRPHLQLEEPAILCSVDAQGTEKTLPSDREIHVFSLVMAALGRHQEGPGARKDFVAVLEPLEARS
jgi:hypothetical protein